ncbi:MAG: T9SS type A sorting domain-containing protein [Melioribacteraceae bacterium]
MKHNKIHLLTFLILMMMFITVNGQKFEQKLIEPFEEFELNNYSYRFENLDEENELDNFYDEPRFNEQILPHQFYKQFAESVNQDVLDSVITIYDDGNKSKFIFTLNKEGKLETVLEMQMDTNNTEWLNKRKSKSLYNSIGLKISDVIEEWDSTQWQQRYRYTAIYNSDSNRTLSLSEYFDENLILTNYIRHTSVYGPDGKSKEVNEEEWEGNTLVKHSRRKTNYDSKGNLTLSLNIKLSNNIVTSGSSRLYRYDAKGNQILNRLMFWKNEGWLNFSQFLQKYNSSNVRIESESQKWNKTKNEWVNFSRHKNTVDAVGNYITGIGEKWEDSLWIESSRSISKYNSNGDRVSYFSEKLDSVWIPSHRDNKQFNNDFKLTLRILEIYEEGLLRTTEREEYSYDQQNNILISLYEERDDGEIKYFGKAINTFDENNNKLSSFTKRWDGSKLTNYRKYLYSYDSDNNLITQINQKWENKTWVRVNSNSSLPVGYNLDYKQNGKYYSNISTSSANIYFFYNGNITSTKKSKNRLQSFSLSQNYPNPFNPSTKIEYSIPLSREARGVSNNVTLTVYDMLGRKVTTLVNQKQKPGNYKVNFNASQLASGIYIYRLQAGDFVETKKLMLMK